MQRRNRLRNAQDFARQRREGRVFRNRLMLMSVLPHESPHNRYGFVVSKQLGNAVTRNRVRRLLREALRLLHPTVKTGYDVVIIARREMVGQSFTTVQSVVRELLLKAQLVESDGL